MRDPWLEQSEQGEGRWVTRSVSAERVLELGVK